MDSIAIATWGLALITLLLVFESFWDQRKLHAEMHEYVEATKGLTNETAKYTQVTQALAEESKNQTKESARLVGEAELARYAEKLPVLYPQGLWLMDAKKQPLQILWSERDLVACIENLGSGPALDVLGVVMGPKPEDNSRNPLYRLWDRNGIAAGSTVDILLQRSGLMVDASTTIRDHTLAPPLAAGAADHWSGRAATYYARLTLTYRDVFARKHAIFFDLTSEKTWRLVAFEQDISFDLADLDLASRPEMPVMPESSIFPSQILVGGKPFFSPMPSIETKVEGK